MTNNKKTKSSTVLKLSHAKKMFRDCFALNDVSLEVKSGEIVAVIGPSGVGKSTLLRCLSLLDTLDDGSLVYGDIQVAISDDCGHCKYADKNTLNKAQSYYSLVFQNYNLFPHYSVLKNVIDAPISVHKRDKEEVIKEAKKILSWMGLSTKVDMVPCELSGGQQQRVAIARALAVRPKILYFDEPTSALDPELILELKNVLRSVAADNISILVVTHEISFAQDLADRIIFMDKGSIVEEGVTNDVLFSPQKERTKQFLATFMQR